MNSSRVLWAAIFAATAHKDQRRLGKLEYPYIVHPLEVAACLIDAGIQYDDILCAAILHDVQEDCSISNEVIFSEFGASVAAYVSEVTDDPALKGAERKQAQVEKVQTMSEGARLIKVADKICNMYDVLYNPPLDWDAKKKADYFDFGLKVFNAANVKNKILSDSFSSLYKAGKFNEQA